MEAHAHNLNIWEVEAGKSGIKYYSQLNSEFKVSLGYGRPDAVFCVCSYILLAYTSCA